MLQCGEIRALKCRGRLTHGVPYEVKDLLGLIPHHTDYMVKLGSNPAEFHSPFPMFVDQQGCPGIPPL